MVNQICLIQICAKWFLDLNSFWAIDKNINFSRNYPKFHMLNYAQKKLYFWSIIGTSQILWQWPVNNNNWQLRICFFFFNFESCEPLRVRFFLWPSFVLNKTLLLAVNFWWSVVCLGIQGFLIYSPDLSWHLLSKFYYFLDKFWNKNKMLCFYLNMLHEMNKMWKIWTYITCW